MLSTTYDNDADALYVTLRIGADAASTHEIDEWTFVDVDLTGAAIGVEVIHPARDWPLHEVLNRYDVSADDQALLEAMFPRLNAGGRISFPRPDQQVQTTTRDLVVR